MDYGSLLDPGPSAAPSAAAVGVRLPAGRSVGGDGAAVGLAAAAVVSSSSSRLAGDRLLEALLHLMLQQLFADFLLDRHLAGEKNREMRRGSEKTT